MSRSRTFFQRMTEACKALESARRVAVAVEGGRAPARRDLERLGIDAAAFASIRQI